MEIKVIQEELLILLKIFNKICLENNIKYSLHGGTLLGAVRERGFIPWDDDADITMTRNEYQKFKKIINDYVCDDIKFKESITSHPILYLQRKNKPAVWIDILIYDFISENFLAKQLKFLGLIFFLGFTKTKTTMKVFEVGVYKGWKSFIVKLLYNFGKLFTMKFKMKLMNKFAEKCFVGNKKFVLRANDQYVALKIILPKNVMSEYIMMSFKDTELMVSKNYHEILVSSYGEDYLVPKKFAENQDNAHFEFRNNQ